MNNIINFPEICFFCKGKINNFICENYNGHYDKAEEYWQHTRIEFESVNMNLNSKYHIMYSQYRQHLCIYDASSSCGNFLFEIKNLYINDFSPEYLLKVLENKIFV